MLLCPTTISMTKMLKKTHMNAGFNCKPFYSFGTFSVFTLLLSIIIKNNDTRGKKTQKYIFDLKINKYCLTLKFFYFFYFFAYTNAVLFFVHISLFYC